MSRQVLTTQQIEQIQLDAWLWASELDCLDSASCRRCGRLFDNMPGDRAWLGFIAQCDCDEWSHIMLHRDPLEHMETLNKIETIRMRSNAVR